MAEHFKGFTKETFQFFDGLENDNSKSYWEANHKTWEEHVKKPVELLVAELEPEFGPIRIFRPNRDIRFSKDKSPYKTWAGITTTDRAAGSIGWFFRIQSSGIRIAVGAMQLSSDQLVRFRNTIVDDKSGKEFEKMSQDLADMSLAVDSGWIPKLKRTPSGYPSDHPREELLHWKGAIVIKEFERADWMYGRKVFDKVHTVWTDASPLKQWLDKHVGTDKTSRT